MVLPEPVWSDSDIQVALEANRNPSNPIRNTWSQDPAKVAVLRAMVSRMARFGRTCERDIGDALAQKLVCFLHSYSLEVEEVLY